MHIRRARAYSDRRTGYDRRKGSNLFVVDNLRQERRKQERRKLPESRQDWVRISKWSSAYKYF